MVLKPKVPRRGAEWPELTVSGKKKQPHEAKNQVLDVEKNSFPAIRKEFWDVEYVDVTSDAAMSRASDIWSAE